MHPKRTAILRIATLAVTALGLSFPAAAHAQLPTQTTLKIDPRATYLHTSNDPNALPAQPINLSALGLEAGDKIRLERLGEFTYGSDGGTLPSMIAVFSSTDELLGPDASHRVPGAINAGSAFTTLPTLFPELAPEPTDIPEDFRISGVGVGSSVVITIPAGAQFLFVTPNDRFFGDNTDPDQDYALRITPDTDGDGLLDDVDADLDGDGVLDTVDQCIPSDMRSQVDTGSGPSSVANSVDTTGCTIQDYVNAYARAATNHDQYVSAVADLASRLQKLGLINGTQKGELVSGAARSSVGK